MSKVFKLMLTAMVCGVMFVGCGGCGNQAKDCCDKHSEAKSAGDQLVDEFEQFVDECVALAEKGAAGDADATVKMQGLALQMLELAVKLQEAEADGTITEEHKAKLEALEKKLPKEFGVQ